MLTQILIASLWNKHPVNLHFIEKYVAQNIKVLKQVVPVWNANPNGHSGQLCWLEKEDDIKGKKTNEETKVRHKKIAEEQ